MAATILDVAKRVGVTMTTVSKVLNNKPSGLKISQTTRQKILQAAQELDYRPSFSARALARGRTFSLGFICGDIHTPYYAEMASKALQRAEAKGYHLLVSITGWDFTKEINCLEMLLGGKVDGVLMISSALQPGTRQYDYIRENRFPLVLPNTHIDGLSSVRCDYHPGMDEAVSHLKSNGHRSICFLGYQFPFPTTDHKHQAFEQACLNHQVTGHVRRSTARLQDARNLGRELAKDPNRPSAIITFSDYIATGLIIGLRDGGLDVPHDIAVLGIDGTEMGEFYCPPLTTIAVNIEALAARSVDLVIQLIEDRTAGPQNVSLPTELIVRGSA